MAFRGLTPFPRVSLPQPIALLAKDSCCLSLTVSPLPQPSPLHFGLRTSRICVLLSV